MNRIEILTVTLEAYMAPSARWSVKNGGGAVGGPLTIIRSAFPCPCGPRVHLSRAVLFN